jgi:hypothetical protein
MPVFFWLSGVFKGLFENNPITAIAGCCACARRAATPPPYRRAA